MKNSESDVERFCRESQVIIDEQHKKSPDKCPSCKNDWDNHVDLCVLSLIEDAIACLKNG